MKELLARFLATIGRDADRHVQYVARPSELSGTRFYAAPLLVASRGLLALRGLIRRKRGLCVACGYDLRGAEHEACPECGARPKSATA